MIQSQKITACAFLYQDGKLFIAKRAATKKFLPNKWELPGGHIEFGESIEGGLQREFQEEFHVNVKVGMPFYVFTYTREKDGEELHVVEIIYFATLADDSQKIQLNPKDHSEYQWISADVIDDYMQPDDEAKAVKRGFELLPKVI